MPPKNLNVAQHAAIPPVQQIVQTDERGYKDADLAFRAVGEHFDAFRSRACVQPSALGVRLQRAPVFGKILPPDHRINLTLVTDINTSENYNPDPIAGIRYTYRPGSYLRTIRNGRRVH